jgi:hypothetical protein
MEAIERAIIEGLEAVGQHVTSADLKWYSGQPLLPRPSMIDLLLRIGDRIAIGIFSREEIEDAAFRVSRPETLRTVQRIIIEAGQLPQ